MEQEEYSAWCISPHVKPISDSEKKKKKIRRLLGQTKSLLSKQQVTSTASPFTMQYTDL